MIKNFRDISKYNPVIKPGLIFRSSALCLVCEENALIEILTAHRINTIIDLRADREIEENSYSGNIKSKFNIVYAPFDPWSQSIEFQQTYNTGTNVEIAYRFFSLECKSSIKKVVETILNSKDAVNIHCHAGKDRTGIVVALLYCLSGVSENEIYTDYLASEMDTKKEYLQILLDIVKKTGGVEKYLQTCNLNCEQINWLKIKLRK